MTMTRACTIATLAVTILAGGSRAWAQDADAAAPTTAAETAGATTAAVDATAAAAATAPEPASEPTGLLGSSTVWDLSCEAGFDLNEGNTSNRQVRALCGASYDVDRWTFSSHNEVNYGLSRYGGRGTDPATGQPIPRGPFRKTVGNWLVELREQYSLTTDERLYGYSVQSAAGDRFAGFKARLVAELGLGYAYVKTDTQSHAVEGGYQWQGEFLTEPNLAGDDFESRHGSVLRLLGNMKLNDVLSAEYMLAYLQNLQRGVDYRIESDASLLVAVNSHIGLRTGIGVDYDNDPSLIAPVDTFGTELAGALVPARKTDTHFYTNLVLTFL